MKACVGHIVRVVGSMSLVVACYSRLYYYCGCMVFQYREECGMFLTSTKVEFVW